MTDMALREKWVRFFDVNSDERTMVQIYCTPGLSARPWPVEGSEEARVDWALRRYEIMAEAREKVGDDQVPFLNVYTGTEIFAEAFGCRVHYSGDNMPFALPKVSCLEEAMALPRPGIDAPSLEKTFRIARKLRQRFPDAPVGLPDIQSPFDIAALIWQKADFFPNCIDEPEAVLELCAKVESVLTEFLDAWFGEFGTDYVAHYPDLFMRGGLTLSEDEAGTIGPEMFRVFCLPALKRLSEHFGGIGIHCCANARAQWGNFAEIPGFKYLNLNQPEDVLEEAFPYFAKIVTQLPHARYGWSGENFEWTRKVPKEAHLVLEANAASFDEARRLYDRLINIR